MNAGQNQFKDRLTLDEANGAWYDADRRYVMVRADVLMGLFRELPAAARLAALDAFARSVAVNGAGSARAYRETVGDGDRLLAVIAETAPQLGWGRWSFGPERDVLRLEVVNSPFASGHGPADAPVCHPIKGMLLTVASIVLKAPAQVREVACTAAGAAACRFEAGLER